MENNMAVITMMVMAAIIIRSVLAGAPAPKKGAAPVQDEESGDSSEQ